MRWWHWRVRIGGILIKFAAEISFVRYMRVRYFVISVLLFIVAMCAVSGKPFAQNINTGLTGLADSIMSMDRQERRLHSLSVFREGERTGDPLVSVYGNTLMGFDYLMNNIYDSALFFLNNAINISEKTVRNESHDKEWNYIMSRAYNSLALYYLNYSLDYYKASEYLYRALESCSQNDDATLYPLLLANFTLIHYFKADTAGMEYSRKLKEWSETHGGKYSFHAGYSMALMYFLREDYKSAEACVMDALHAIEKGGDKYNREYIFAYNLLGKIYLKTGDRRRALSALKKASQIAENGTISDITDTFLALGNFYLEEGQYDTALKTMLDGISICDSTSTDVHYNELLESISYIYTRKNDYKSALDFYMRYHAHEEALFNRNKEYALGEIRAKYNLGQYENKLKEQEITILRRNQQLILLVFAIVIIVSAAGVVWYFYYKKNKYYEKIVNQYKEQVSLNRQIRELEEMNSDKYNKSSLSETKGNDLWMRLKQYMEEDKAYRDSALTIDRLALKLSTNRSYLSRVINEYSGMNFNQYLNKYRIEEAIRSMTESRGECLLKSMAFDLGFKSTSGFNKAFLKETGIPPSVFRDKCRK